MNLQELIQKNNEEFEDKFNEENIIPDEVQYDRLKQFIDDKQQSILNNILEYIEGEKMKANDKAARVLLGKEITDIIDARDAGILIGKYKMAELIADYIKGDNK